MHACVHKFLDPTRLRTMQKLRPPPTPPPRKKKKPHYTVIGRSKGDMKLQKRKTHHLFNLLLVSTT